jgi:hypothetical protein
MNTYQVIYTIVVHAVIWGLLCLWHKKAVDDEPDIAYGARLFLTLCMLLSVLFFGIWALIAIGRML